jgi:hypothetical protein
MKYLCVYLIIFHLVVSLSVSKEVIISGIYETFNGTEYVYQMPESSPKGIVFLAHGCSHSSTDFFPQSEKCKKCIGLPIELSITSEVLNRNMIPIAISSINRENKCWNYRDKNSFLDVMEEFYRSKLKKTIPLYLFGASSGGRFVGMMGRVAHSYELPISGIIIEISNFLASTVINPFPIVFIHMPKDEILADHISSTLSRLRTLQVPFREYKVMPKAIHSEYFAFQNVLSTADSKLLVSALKSNVYLTSDDYLVDDPRRSNWREVTLFHLSQFQTYQSLLINSSMC